MTGTLMRQFGWARMFALGGLLLLGTAAGNVQADEVVMKVLVVNPSETEVKEFRIQSALPPEVRPEHVLDADGLHVDYDSQTGTYVLTGSVTLKPRETLTRHVVLEDVWVIASEHFTDLRQETWSLLAKLRGTTYEDQGKLLSSSISRRLATVEVSQQQPILSPEQHISLYRDNLKTLESIETELVSLRQLMVMAAVAPVAESMLGTPSPATDRQGGLSILTTWRVIFIILGLLGFVSLSFFLLWQRQLKLQLAKQETEEDADDADLFTNGHDAPAAGATTAPPGARLQPKTPLSS